MYQLKKQKIISAPIEKVWKFISTPQNLKLITPSEMGFQVISDDIQDKMYAGMIIKYRVKPLLNIPTTWVTEITHVEENKFFIDEQRIGPYKMWHHQHILEETDTGTLMTDIVSYLPPFGPFGRIANRLIIAKNLEYIFNFREQKLNEIFK